MIFPTSADKLSFSVLANHWSEESGASQKKLLSHLEAAWWVGEIRGNSDRLQLLKQMFERRYELYLPVVFVTPDDAGPPVATPGEAGGVLVDVRPRVEVHRESDNWTENSCDEAFKALATFPSHDYYPLFSLSIHFIDITREEFFGWIRTRGFDVPMFWKMNEPPSSRGAAPKREGSGEEDQKQTTRSPLKRDLEAAYEQRIESYQGKKAPSRKEDEKWAKEQFGLGVAKARNLRRALAPSEWHNPGRRKARD